MIWSIGNHIWKGKISKAKIDVALKGGGSMTMPKNGLEWNDCSKCKNFSECYHKPKGTDNIMTSMPKIIWSLCTRDLCLHNAKRLFSPKI